MTNFNVTNGTYGELKNCVESTKHMVKLPLPKQLVKMDLEKLFQVHRDGADITVYKNGLVLYEEGGNRTVFGVDRCGVKESIAVEDGNKLIWILRDIDENIFDDYPWYLPICGKGMERIDRSRESQAYNKKRFSFNADAEDENFADDEALCIFDEFDDECEDGSVRYKDGEYLQEEKSRRQRELCEAVHKAKESLTVSQAEAIELIAIRKMTYEEASAVLGVKPQTVHDRMTGAKKKFEKCCKKFLR